MKSKNTKIHDDVVVFQEILVFVDSPNKKLFCRLCGKVFKDPVIVTCGVST